MAPPKESVKNSKFSKLQKKNFQKFDYEYFGPSIRIIQNHNRHKNNSNKKKKKTTALKVGIINNIKHHPLFFQN